MSLSSTNVESDFAARSETAGSTSVGIYGNYLKRLVDLGAVAMAAVFVLPFLAVICALISLDGHLPFFVQRRVGRHGREFRMWKLRTMVPRAEERLEAHLAANPDARAEWDQTQKLKIDPRITPIGRILRKSSLDELPQFFNVLTGDMSLVGPRPMLPSQTVLYPGSAYYTMRPGITGLWQVSERNESEFASRATFDSIYLETLGLKTDVLIAVRTVGVVFRGTGY